MTVKLFLGSISMDTTPDSISRHFEKYGQVTDTVVISKDGIPRGFGFVTFETEESASAALNDEHNLDGRHIDVKRATPKDEDRLAVPSGGGRGPPPDQSAIKSDKVFVGGLPQDCEDQKIIDHFQRYGTIVDAVVMKDRTTGRSRGFGFVRFDNTDSADRVLEDYSNHQIEGKWCEVKKAVPQEQMPPPRSDKFDKGGSKGSSAVAGSLGSSAYGGYGMGMMGGYPMGMAGYGMMGMYGNPMMAGYAGYGAYGYGGYPDPYAQYGGYAKASGKGNPYGNYSPY